MKTFWEFLRYQVSNIKSLICKKLFMRSKVTDRLFLLAYTDTMTGAKNRNAYEEAFVKLRNDAARLDKIKDKPVMALIKPILAVAAIFFP